VCCRPAAGRADIATGQAQLSAKLDTLLQRQQAALDAIARAEAQVAAVRGLSEKQATALTELRLSVDQQLAAISLATQNSLINLYQVHPPPPVLAFLPPALVTVESRAPMPCTRS
jgi:hypothetical protein